MTTISVKVVKVSNQNSWYHNSVGRTFSDVHVSIAKQAHMSFKAGDLVYKMYPGIFSDYSAVYFRPEDVEIVEHINSDSEQNRLFERIFQN